MDKRKLVEKPISRLLDVSSSAPKKEKELWKYLKTIMGHRWHAQRHEDKYAEGIPDVSFGCRTINGWIELKCIAEWPQNKHTVVPVPITPIQKQWLFDRRFHAKNIFVLLRVGRSEFLLFDQFSELGQTTQENLRNIAKKIWKRDIDPDEFSWEIIHG